MVKRAVAYGRDLQYVEQLWIDTGARSQDKTRVENEDEQTEPKAHTVECKKVTHGRHLA